MTVTLIQLSAASYFELGTNYAPQRNPLLVGIASDTKQCTTRHAIVFAQSINLSQGNKYIAEMH